MNTILQPNLTERELAAEETVSLISSARVEDARVFGPDEEKIGHVDHLMIDKRAGTVSYAVIRFGGFLGLGEKLHPLPWAALRYDPSLDGYRVGITRDQLDGAPEASASEPRWADPDYRKGIRDHYGAMPLPPMI